MKSLKISVIIPVHNKEKHLMDAIESIKEQDYDNFECILVDDGSTDSSPEIIKEVCKKDRRFKAFRQKNTGPSGARNNGIAKAKGDYILFLDADDILLEHAMKNLVDHVRATGVTDHVLVGQVINYSENLKPMGNARFPFTSRITVKELFARHQFQPSGVFAPKKVLPTPLFDPKILGSSSTRMFCEDVDCWMMLVQTGVHIEGVSFPVSGIRQSKNSISRRKGSWFYMAKGIDVYVDRAIEREKANNPGKEIDVKLFEDERWFWRIQFYCHGLMQRDPEAYALFCKAFSAAPKTVIPSLIWCWLHEYAGERGRDRQITRLPVGKEFFKKKSDWIDKLEPHVDDGIVELFQVMWKRTQITPDALVDKLLKTLEASPQYKRVIVGGIGNNGKSFLSCLRFNLPPARPVSLLCWDDGKSDDEKRWMGLESVSPRSWKSWPKDALLVITPLDDRPFMRAATSLGAKLGANILEIEPEFLDD